MSKQWPTVKLGDVLRLDLDRVTVDAATTYPMVGVLSFGRGLFNREPIENGNTSYRTFYRLKPDHIVMSQLFGWEGALALSSAEFSGKFLSPQFPTFVCNEAKLDRAFLGWMMRRPAFWADLGSRTSGMGDRRRTLNPEALFACEITLPSLTEQQRTVKRIEELAKEIQDAQDLRQAALNEVKSLMPNQIEALFNYGRKVGWTLGRLGDYVVDDRYGTSEKTNDDSSGTPVLRMGNIQDGQLRTSSLKYLHITDKERDKLILKRGDILVNRTNSAELVGKCAVFELDGEFAFASYIIRLRLDKDRADSRFVASYINSPAGRAYMFSERKQMTGQANVNATKLKALPIALPPLPEQLRLVAELDVLKSEVDRLKKLQAESAVELDALLPSVLSMAFAGEL